jgi:hypothetical protein
VNSSSSPSTVKEKTGKNSAIVWTNLLFNPTTVWRLFCDHLKRLLAGVGPPQACRLLSQQATGPANCGS